MKLSGKVSWFGGPEDQGVSPSEQLAWWETWEQVVEDGAEDLFLKNQPSGTTGLARRLNPDKFYLACRFDYAEHSKSDLSTNAKALVRAENGRQFLARPADWGPNENTGRVADISPGLMTALGIETDAVVTVTYPAEGAGVDWTTPPSVEEGGTMTYSSVVINSGHGKYVRGASGVLDEVDEARKVTERLAEVLRERGVTVKTFHDDTSRDQNTNLKTIVAYHNKQTRDLDISVHFNAYEQTSRAMGVEVLYLTQSALASDISRSIASCGFIDRGGKKRSDLYFLNNTDKPAVLIETCFVDSTADAEMYNDEFEAICEAIANELAGEAAEELPLPPARPSRPPTTTPRIDIAVSGDIILTVNGVIVSS